MLRKADPQAPVTTPAEQCDLCGGRDYEVVAETCRHGLPLRNVLCKRCGLAYLLDRPTAEALADFYASCYRYQYDHVAGLAKWKLRSKHERAERRWAGIKRFLAPGCKLLEVGCAEGSLLSIAAADGFEVIGVEADPELAGWAKKQGNHVLVGMLEDVVLREASFGAVLAFHVVEHANSAVEFLGVLRRHLADDGILVLEVPDLAHPYGALEEFLQLAHTYTFTSNTLDLMLRKVGFEPIASELIDGHMVRTIARRAEPDVDIAFESEGDDWQALKVHLENYRRDYRPVAPTFRARAHSAIRWMFGPSIANKAIDVVIDLKAMFRKT